MVKKFETAAIEAVAAYVAEGFPWAGDAIGREEGFAEVEKINDRSGWTVDQSAPLGGTIRTEGVQLSDADLTVAWILGLSWLDAESTYTGYMGMMTVTEARALAKEASTS